MKRRLTAEEWEQVRTAHASGIGLRELARNMGISEGTVLSRARREGWTAALNRAKNLARLEEATITPAEAVAQSLADDSHATRLGFSRATRRAAEHAARLEPDAVMRDAGKIRDLANTARIVHGWDEQQTGPVVNVAILGMLSEAAEQTPSSEAGVSRLENGPSKSQPNRTHIGFDRTHLEFDRTHIGFD